MKFRCSSSTNGARPASIYTANTKAVTAATFRAPTGPLPAGTTAPDPLFNLSLQLAALAGGGKLTTLGGGLPIIVDNQIIGVDSLTGAPRWTTPGAAKWNYAVFGTAARDGRPAPGALRRGRRNRRSR